MRQLSKLQVHSTKDEFTTSDPAMIYQPTNEAEEPLKEEVPQNASLKFGKKQFGHLHGPMNVGSATTQQR